MNKCFAALNRSGKIALLIAGLSAFAPAHAEIIVDQSNGGSMGSGWTNNGTDFSIWDDFKLDSKASITGITYFTWINDARYLSDYTLKIGRSAGQADVLNLSIAKSATTLTAAGGVGRIEASFAAVNLDAGTYWLSFTNPGNIYGSTNIAGGNLVQMSQWGNYVRDGSAAAFMLEGTSAAVPEPGSLALLGLGLFGFAAARRKARSTS